MKTPIARAIINTNKNGSKVDIEVFYSCTGTSCHLSVQSVFVKGKSKKLLELFIKNILRIHLVKTKKEANKKFFLIGFSQKKKFIRLILYFLCLRDYQGQNLDNGVQ